MTTSPLTPAELPALRALYEKATPGPWRAMSSIDESFTPGWVRSARRDGGGYIAGITAREIERTFRRYEDAEFAATARDALPRACATIEAQAKTIAELREEAETLRDALSQGAAWFWEYESGHRAKGDVAKADRNRDRATFLARAALAKEPT